MDQQAREPRLDIAGATVARVGEGIQVTFASGLLYDFDSDAIRSEAAAPAPRADKRGSCSIHASLGAPARETMSARRHPYGLALGGDVLELVGLYRDLR